MSSTPVEPPHYQLAPGPAPIRTNVLAIIAFVAAFVVPIAAIVLGHMGMVQIRQTGEAGYGLAKAGMIIGYVFTSLYVLFFIVWLTMFLSIASQVPWGSMNALG